MASSPKVKWLPEESTCTFSPDRVHRYVLRHTFVQPSGARPRCVAWVGLNPSTAFEASLDPTLRRVRAFSYSMGYEGFIMLNAYAFRATLPEDMKRAPDPVGPDNDRHLLEVANEVDLIIACWGTHATFMGRDTAVKALLKGRLSTLKLTKDGHPSHPLYLPANLRPIPFA